MDNPTPAPTPRRRLATAAEVCREYLSRTFNGANATTHAKQRKIEIERFIEVRGHIAIDDMIADDLESYVESRKGLKSEWSKKNLAQSIKRCFAWAWGKGLIGTHPLKSVSYSGGSRRKAMSEEHFRLILSSVGPEVRRPLLFLWWTGARPIELCNLRWSFIDPEKGIAVLHEHKTSHSRRDREPRRIFLPEKALRMLNWMLHDQRDEEQFVFLNAYGRPWKRHALSRRILRTRRKLGIPNDVFVYGIRHQFGTRMALAGVELKTLSLLMGHTNTLQSEHYLHLAGEMGHLHKALETGLAFKREEKPHGEKPR